MSALTLVACGLIPISGGCVRGTALKLIGLKPETWKESK